MTSHSNTFTLSHDGIVSVSIISHDSWNSVTYLFPLSTQRGPRWMCVNQTQTLTPINPVVQRGGGGEAVSDVPVWGEVGGGQWLWRGEAITLWASACWLEHMKRGGCSIRSREVGQGQTAYDFQDGRPDLPDVRTPRECRGGGGCLLCTPLRKKGGKKAHTARSLQATDSKMTWQLQFGDTERERLSRHATKAATRPKWY